MVVEGEGEKCEGCGKSRAGLAYKFRLLECGGEEGGVWGLLSKDVQSGLRQRQGACCKSLHHGHQPLHQWPLLLLIQRPSHCTQPLPGCIQHAHAHKVAKGHTGRPGERGEKEEGGKLQVDISTPACIRSCATLWYSPRSHHSCRSPIPITPVPVPFPSLT